MVSRPIGIGLIGIGGYGVNHVATLRTLDGVGLARLVAVADPTADRFPAIVQGLKADGVAHYDDYRDLLARSDIGAVVICTPIPQHTDQAVAAFNAGKHVYLEKPPCVAIDQLNRMEAARVKADKICAVGFQKQTEACYAFLRNQLASGILGELTDIWAGVRWSRDDAYYNRSRWAGRLTLDGEPVLDGPATNALAHIIHAGLSLLGAPTRVRGCLRHARPIDSYDSSYIEVDTEDGVNARFMMSHATQHPNDTVLYCRGTKGTVIFNWNLDVTVFADGLEPVTMSFPCQEVVGAMLNFVVAVDQGRKPATSLTDTLPLLLAVNGALKSGGLPSSFTGNLIGTLNPGTDRQLYTVKGLDHEMDAFVADNSCIPTLLKPGPWIAAADVDHSFSAS